MNLTASDKDELTSYLIKIIRRLRRWKILKGKPYISGMTAALFQLNF